jgi:valyl-tRNA synthetase
MDEKLLKPYDPKATEDAIYKRWEESGFFNPDVCVEKSVCDKDAEAFSIVLPPPNVTGTLHMGHAAMLAVEDILVRYNRMHGKKTLWLPGTDHAAIATQSKVEKIIYKKEKKSRHDLGREEFLSRVNEFAQDSHDTIVNQVRKMGSSVDWSREAFTLDKKRELAVRTAFKKMYDLGLIYRGNRIVNWDPKGQTTVSDEEVVHEERKGRLYTFKYSKDFPISIATTRPETKLGDTAVAVHPDDARYKEYIGKEYDIDFAGTQLKIKIVGDKEVDPDFGTGAVGVTPAHSTIDWLIGERHKLPVVQVINEYAKMTVGNDDILGKKTTVARDAVVKWLEDKKLLEKVEETDQNISIAERSGGVIEPLPKLQWFINVNKKFTLEKSLIDVIEDGAEVTLKELMLAVVNNKQIKIVPERFEKIYFHWIENLHDWCISRQIWYGHRIPVWYKGNEIYTGTKAPEGDGWTQDEDTLDTWFSSGLWTFSTLGWPEDTIDFKTFHPTSILETGYDILFFWVAKMILMSTCLLGDIPFKYVYLHGLVRDEKGRKMSKSIGNIIDPLDMIEKYGADAVRMSLIVGTSPGNDTKLSEQKIKAYKHFANKLWNITRFILSNTVDSPQTKPEKLLGNDEEWLKDFNSTADKVTNHLQNYQLHLAADELYQWTWHRLADVCIEESKPILNGDDTEAAASRRWLLMHMLKEITKLLHPFMPFITEEIWGVLPVQKTREFLMIESWPETNLQ